MENFTTVHLQCRQTRQTRQGSPKRNSRHGRTKWRPGKQQALYPGLARDSTNSDYIISWWNEQLIFTAEYKSKNRLLCDKKKTLLWESGNREKKESMVCNRQMAAHLGCLITAETKRNTNVFDAVVVVHNWWEPKAHTFQKDTISSKNPSESTSIFNLKGSCNMSGMQPTFSTLVTTSSSSSSSRVDLLKFLPIVQP